MSKTQPSPKPLTEDEVLLRMLQSPPKPHKPKTTPAKKASKKP